MRVFAVLLGMLAVAPVFAELPPDNEVPIDPTDNPSTPAKVALGKALFWEEQLSVTRTVACGTCHRPSSGGADPRSNLVDLATRHPGPDGIFDTPDDITGSMGVPAHTRSGSYIASPFFGFAPQVGERAAPSMINSGFLPSLLWDASVTDGASGPGGVQGALEKQALLPLVDPVEMSAVGDTLDDVPARIENAVPLAVARDIPATLRTWIAGRGYPALFEQAFGSPDITANRIAMAIASYERSLISLPEPSPTLTPLEQQGQQVFLANCATCHSGRFATDFEVHYIGVHPSAEDPGHFAVSADPNDRGAMRTPSLRNVALRKTFMHHGGLFRLSDVLVFYTLGRFDEPHRDPLMSAILLSVPKREALAAFLQTLTDPRVAAETPPFDRPRLYSETDRVPRLIGAGRAGVDGVPQLRAIEPPLLGTSFTVTVENARANADGTLVVSHEDPGLAATLPDGDFAAIAFTTDAAGRASIDLPLPDDPLLDGLTLRGRAYLPDPAAANGLAITRAFEIRLFRAGTDVFLDGFE